MTTIPSRLARATKTIRSPEEARTAVFQLYRDWYRGAPEICALYTLPVSEQYVRQAIRRRFEENRHVTDLQVLNHLLLKGRQEYQETMNFWKQREHVLGRLITPRGRPARSFLEKFYEGRDEDQVLPAPTGTLLPTP
ncbi:hypothetical protein PHLGIDRAFT_107023 [Phlebiopsis gigantea 11061_1 CR5-6]|uniref:Complex 1 LYR protein domain-containing protein n=1 Tax=Phlebiopsis gigantea (strain 11061_1 CR5-6) TaxID=745531 RepID=A0A0C3NMX4_PHLG1|nr:hypothetical protein PHLGIDRAFT_107023 [Phlebiopsis gigantea 11061_1 CR5-6]